ncbi:MAG: hypothetical protein M1821_009604 [Bathelium mastoideum]|nr:MAG: hypothetical protein M1821_009604 [Bathelium mastoideum]
MYLVGLRTAPVFALGGSIAYGYLAVKTAGARVPLALYTTAAITLFSIVPYTLTAMRNVNTALENRANDAFPPGSPSSSLETAEKGDDGESETRALIERWSRLNLVRTGLEVVSTVVGIWAVASRPETVAVVVREGGSGLVD